MSQRGVSLSVWVHPLASSPLLCGYFREWKILWLSIPSQWAMTGTNMSSRTFSCTGMLLAWHIWFTSLIPFSRCDKVREVRFCRGENIRFVVLLFLTHGGLVGRPSDCHHIVSGTYTFQPYPYHPCLIALQRARVISSWTFNFSIFTFFSLSLSRNERSSSNFVAVQD